MDGVQFGLATDGLTLDRVDHPNQILLNINGYYGGYAEGRRQRAGEGGNAYDELKAVYDVDASTLAFYRNGIAWGSTLQLNLNATTNKANLMFFVSVHWQGYNVTLM